MMGSWFLATAYSEFVAAQIAKLASVPTIDGQVTDIQTALASYMGLYSDLFWVGVGFGAAMLLISPLLRKLMHGVH
jgi:POT family proton-dependent oligopeptide transporter